jgi:hypothetical protein
MHRGVQGRIAFDGGIVMAKASKALLGAASALFLAISFPTPASAQQAQELRTPIDRAARIAVIEGALRQVNRYYVSPEVARQMEVEIRKRLRAKEYDTVATAEGLVEKLSRDLQLVSHDLHLRVVYSREPRLIPDTSATKQAEAERAYLEEVRTEGLSRNFGFEAATRLAGNVGYLKLSTFFPRDMSIETARGALAMLASTDALIIDLRDNSGGDPKMVDWLQGYFVDVPRGTSISYNRITNRTDTSAMLVPTPGNERFIAKPLYILLSGQVFSAPEVFARPLQSERRAVVVGEQTRGGTHLTTAFPIDEHFSVRVPHSRSIPDWEGKGITPDVAVPAAQAQGTAHLLAIERLLEAQPNAYPELVAVRKQVAASLRRQLGRE